VQGWHTGRDHLRRPRHTWVSNNKTELQEIARQGMNWDSSGSEEGQILGSCECGNDSYGSIKCREFLEKLRN